MPEELKQQLEYMNFLSVAHGYYITAKAGVEADDLLASFSAKLKECGETSYIASGDKDFAQCVGERTFQMLPPIAQSKGTWRILDWHGIKGNFGVFPEQIVDYLSLLGDSSDHILGVEGIGAKRAENLLNQFDNIENLLQNLDKIPSEKIRKNLSNSLGLIERNRELITLRKTMEFHIPATTISRSPEDIFNLLQNLQLNSLLASARKRYKLPEQAELFDDIPR
jgi:DNA polymerase-1